MEPSFPGPSLVLGGRREPKPGKVRLQGAAFSKERVGSKGEAEGGSREGDRGYCWSTNTGSKFGTSWVLSSVSGRSRGSLPTPQKGSQEPWVPAESRPLPISHLNHCWAPANTQLDGGIMSGLYPRSSEECKVRRFCAPSSWQGFCKIPQSGVAGTV